MFRLFLTKFLIIDKKGYTMVFFFFDVTFYYLMWLSISPPYDGDNNNDDVRDEGSHNMLEVLVK